MQIQSSKNENATGSLLSDYPIRRVRRCQGHNVPSYSKLILYVFNRPILKRRSMNYSKVCAPITVQDYRYPAAVQILLRSLCNQEQVHCLVYRYLEFQRTKSQSAARLQFTTRIVYEPGQLRSLDAAAIKRYSIGAESLCHTLRESLTTTQCRQSGLLIGVCMHIPQDDNLPQFQTDAHGPIDSPLVVSVLAACATHTNAFCQPHT